MKKWLNRKKFFSACVQHQLEQDAQKRKEGLSIEELGKRSAVVIICLRELKEWRNKTNKEFEPGTGDCRQKL